MKVIVMGCGRMGQKVARTLAAAGHEVTAIDSDPKLLALLGSDFSGRKVQGVGFDRKVLIASGIETADAFAATGPSDNTNIVAARIAHDIFRVPRVVIRLYDPRRAEIAKRLGMVAMSMIDWGAGRIVELITHSNLDPILSLGQGEVILTSIEIPQNLAGRTVRDLLVPSEINVIAVIREGKALLPNLGMEFCNGDLVYLSVQAEAIDRLEALIGI